MADRIAQTGRNNRGASLVAALRDLTDGVGVLIRQHLELVRLEVKEDARILGGHAAVLIFFGAVSFLGYGLLNCAAILFAGWGFGLHGAALTAFLLAAVNLGFGLRAMWNTMKRLEADGIALDRTARELEKDMEWVKEIREK